MPEASKPLKKNPVRQILVHRLVAYTFSPDADPALVVDHIDGDKKNNRLDNLQMVSHPENTKRAYERGNHKRMVKIAQYDLEGNLVDTHKSGADALRSLGLDPKNTGMATHMRVKSADFKGFVWRRVAAEGEGDPVKAST
jgi:hypothetical protein